MCAWGAYVADRAAQLELLSKLLCLLCQIPRHAGVYDHMAGRSHELMDDGLKLGRLCNPEGEGRRVLAERLGGDGGGGDASDNADRIL